jgi:hypothetical protein
MPTRLRHFGIDELFSGDFLGFHVPAPLDNALNNKIRNY